MTRWIQRGFGLLAAVAILQVGAAAQLSPDGLDGGPCCTPTQPYVPLLNNFTQDSLQICWQDCDIEDVNPCQVEWIHKASSRFIGVDGFATCGRQVYQVKLRDASGTKWVGRVRLTNAGIGQPLPRVFVDQANSLRAGATTMNVFYRSDHILNLNY